MTPETRLDAEIVDRARTFLLACRAAEIVRNMHPATLLQRRFQIEREAAEELHRATLGKA